MTSPHQIRVITVDDQPLVLAGLRALLDRADDITVIGEATDGSAAVALARAHSPDVMLMDIRMPGTDGIAATRTIATDPDLAHIRVIVLTTFDTDEHIFDAIGAGAAGFLLKDTDAEQLRAAVRTVAGGDALLSPAVTTRVLRRLADERRHTQRRPTPPAVDQLTSREQEVLTHIGRGLSNDEIAAALFISPATARTYVSRLLTKLDARDRVALVIAAYESGLR